MKLTFRWYGLNDSIPLEYIKEIPNMYSVVTSLYDKKPGQIWDKEELLALKKEVNAHGLKMEVIESIPVSEEIKLGSSKRDEHIASFRENLKMCAEAGVKVVCYNFMPVFDWIRTDLEHHNPDYSTSLSYSEEELKKMDPKHLHLPGWDESYKSEELHVLLDKYASVSREQLFDNYVYFLKAVMDICDEYDISLAVHPDDPPWNVFDLPRIVSSEDDLDRLFKAVPDLHNGLTLCTGSLGEKKQNDVVHMAAKYSKEGRLYFAHLRNILRDDKKGDFIESGHFSKDGSLDMYEIVLALVRNGFDGYVRPDHGRNIFGEKGKPGYGLYDRALGCTYINGLFEAVEKAGKERK